MEPGLRDREYAPPRGRPQPGTSVLQWSPVLETGNTASRQQWYDEYERAAMEPGLRDREYTGQAQDGAQSRLAAMEPGLRDREYGPGAPLCAL